MDRDLERERRILKLRYRAGAQLIAASSTRSEHAAPSFELLPDGLDLPEVAPAELTPGLLRGAILEHGCLLVRGLADSGEATRFAGEIDRAFEAREVQQSGASAPNGYYEEFEPDPPDKIDHHRPWIREAGGLWAADSPKLMFEMLEMFERAGLRELISGYLGEPTVLSAHKCTLRKAEPGVAGAWHQDGSFMGEVHSLNAWLSLSHCGDDAPGLDIVPRRLDHFVRTGGEGIVLDIHVSQEVAEEAAGEVGILRPIFEPGDALLFDHLFLHQTGSDPEMPNPRFAVESWFFGPSGFPDDYVPIAC